MSQKSEWHRRISSMFVVAPAARHTWAVAFSRQLIPGAIFSSRAAAVRYACMLASLAGLDGRSVRILGTA